MSGADPRGQPPDIVGGHVVVPRGEFRIRESVVGFTHQRPAPLEKGHEPVFGRLVSVPPAVIAAAGAGAVVVADKVAEKDGDDGLF